MAVSAAAALSADSPDDSDAVLWNPIVGNLRESFVPIYSVGLQIHPAYWNFGCAVAAGKFQVVVVLLQLLLHWLSASNFVEAEGSEKTGSTVVPIEQFLPAVVVVRRDCSDPF